MRSFVVVPALAVALGLAAVPAYAYLDPGTGSYVFQMDGGGAGLGGLRGEGLLAPATVRLFLPAPFPAAAARMSTDEVQPASYRDPSGFDVDPADARPALALGHYLAIGRTVPLPHLARWMDLWRANV